MKSVPRAPPSSENSSLAPPARANAAATSSPIAVPICVCSEVLSSSNEQIWRTRRCTSGTSCSLCSTSSMIRSPGGCGARPGSTPPPIELPSRTDPPQLPAGLARWIQPDGIGYCPPEDPRSQPHRPAVLAGPGCLFNTGRFFVLIPGQNSVRQKHPANHLAMLLHRFRLLEKAGRKTALRPFCHSPGPRLAFLQRADGRPERVLRCVLLLCRETIE